MFCSRVTSFPAQVGGAAAFRRKSSKNCAQTVELRPIPSRVCGVASQVLIDLGAAGLQIFTNTEGQGLYG